MTEIEAVETINTLFQSWYPAAVRYARRLTAHTDVAEDSVQEAFLSLYRELRSGKTVINPKAWTLKAVRVQVRVRMGTMRDEASKRHKEWAVDEIPDRDAGDATGDDVRSWFSVLTEREREVIFLRLAEMKYREIAAELGISSSSVNTLLARALRKLQRATGNGTSAERLMSEKNEGDAPQALQ